MIQTPSPAIGSFAERYLLAHFPSGGVIVDLVTGNYFRVNTSAAVICEILRSTDDRARALSHVGQELGIDPEEAGRALSGVIATLSAPSVRGEIQGSYHFFPAGDGYELWHGDHRVLQVDGGSLEIRLASGAETTNVAQLELYVRALAPKLLFQGGVTVLHASACLAAGTLIAFAGLSGAGKTTTAKAFGDAGARVFSEDLVILGPQKERAEILVEGEATVQAWAAKTAAQLRSAPSEAAPPIPVASVVEGPTADLDLILFLDRSRRRGTDLTTSTLEKPDALVSLMAHDFLGAAEPRTWRRFFGDAVAMIRLVELRAASVPDGLERLATAATRYMSSTAS